MKTPPHQLPELSACFKQRRHRLLKQLKPNAAVIIFGNEEILRNGDSTYPFRQNSNFYYLTGFSEPQAVAVFLPGRAEGEYVLFCRERDPQKEQWDGLRAGTAGAKTQFGADQSFAYEKMMQEMPLLLAGRLSWYCCLGVNTQQDQWLIQWTNKMRSEQRRGVAPPVEMVHLEPLLAEMRVLKDATEIALCRTVCQISAKAHREAMKLAPHVHHEYELEAQLLKTFYSQGAQAVAYSSIVGSGPNSCILHYRENNRAYAPTDLILIDAGGEYQNYAADITRTFPAGGRFSPEQKAIYELVLQSQLAGIAVIKPGVLWDTVQSVIVAILTEGLVGLGLLKGSVAALIAQEAYLPFYMHKSGHWLGLDVHDAGCYKQKGQWRAFEPGMLLTVEPGLYISAQIPGVDPKWWNIGVRIEDDVLVTPDGCEVLTQDAPKTVEDIERWMAG
jgi:Xaa-Pro aminopeptidase